MADDLARQEHVWRTSVTELVALFREAITALVPVLDRAQIRWRLGEAYDQWDVISETLFAQIVIDPIRYALTESTVSESIRIGRPLNVARYGFAPLDDHVTVQQRGAAIDGRDPSFVRFYGESPKFDEIFVILRDSPELVGPYQFDECVFGFTYRRDDGVTATLFDLAMEL